MYPKIKLCLTSCKRPDLLDKTLDSFFTSCKDLDLISGYYVFDDGTDKSDLDSIAKKYPQVVIFNNQERGQPYSINKILEFVREDEWYLHYEDDWVFTREGHCVRDMFDIANKDSRVKNVTLRDWRGVIIKDKDFLYRIHTYRYPCSIKGTDNRWYSFSFNPGILHIPTLLSLGAFDETYPLGGAGWDKPPAKRFMELGFRRANPFEGYVQHIGWNRSSYTFV